MGVPLDDMVLWDPHEIWGGLDPEAVKQARIILWKGHCSVHARFTVRQIEQLRAQHPGIRVIVHPEVPWDVVQAADDSGSTEYIIRQVKSSPAGSVWAVGTEIHLVNRLAQQVQPDRTVYSHRSVRLSLLDDVSRVAQPSACGFSKGSSPARFTTASSCRPTRSTGPGSRSTACSPFRSTIPCFGRA